MEIVLLFGLPVVAAILYLNTVTIIKKANKGEETTRHTTIGSLLLALILFGIVFLIKTSSWQ